MENKSSEVILRMEGISKSFPGVKALKGVKLEVRRGEVHVLLGENGAGKSTLMKIIVGAYQPDEGEIIWKGKPVRFSSPREAQESGISIVYQELNLIPHLTAVENAFLGRPITKGIIVDWREMERLTEEKLKELGLSFPLHIPVKYLTTAQQQMIEIVRALLSNAQLIIMDEPTSSLSEREIRNLFQVIRYLKSQGVSFIYISHRMEEIKEIGDRVTVLRDGEYIGTVDVTEDLDMDQLIRMMVGREIKEKYPKESAPRGEELLRVEGLTCGDKLKDISFTLYRGEVLGIAGLVGSGRTRLVRCIFGAEKVDKGEIYLGGRKLDIRAPWDAIRYGIALLPEDRKVQGLVLNNTVRFNTTLASLDKLIKGLFGFLDLRAEAEKVSYFIDKLKVKTPSMEQIVKYLSGGNQQKVVLAKWLFRDSEVIIFDEPTRGIDVGAKVEIYKLMNELTREGKGIIMISSELPEILGMSDRIMVMSQGRLAGILSKEEATQEKIMKLATS